MFVTIRRRWSFAALGVAILASWGFVTMSNGEDRATNPPNTGMADPVAIMKAFDRFLSSLPPNGGGRFLVIPLTGLRGLTSESFNAGGSLRIDFTDGSIVSQVKGLPAAGAFDLWLIDNRPSGGHATLADSRDVLMKVGTYRQESGAHLLSVTFGRPRFAEFSPDLAFVVRSNQSPLNAFVLTGSANICERLYRRQVGTIDDPTAPSTRAAHFAADQAF